MGRRGPKPDYAKRAAFAKLIAEGVPSARASRMVGINPCTGKRWRHGRKIISAGQMLDLAPVIITRPVRRYSPRYLSEDERLRLADLRRDRMSVRAIATLMGRAPSTISRELRRGADQTDRYRPHEAHRRALERRHLKRPSKCPKTTSCASGSVAGSWPGGARSRSATSCPPSFPTTPADGSAPRRSTRPSTALTWAACPASCLDASCAVVGASASRADTPASGAPAHSRR